MTALSGGLGAVALATAVALPLARRTATVGALLTAQGAALALAAIAQGLARGQPLLGLLAGALIAARAAGAAPALRRIACRRVGDLSAAGTGGIASVTVAVVLVGAAIAIARQVSAAPGTVAPDDLALAIGMLLVGPLVIVACPGAPWAIAGVLTVEAGAALAAISASPVMAFAEAIAAWLALAAAVPAVARPRRASGAP